MGFENSKVLDVTNTETLYKLAVYVPNTHEIKLKMHYQKLVQVI